MAWFMLPTVMAALSSVAEAVGQQVMVWQAARVAAWKAAEAASWQAVRAAAPQEVLPLLWPSAMARKNWCGSSQ
jgi:hypothetical protein